MKREKELVRNTLVLAVGRFLPQVFNLITIPIITYYLTKSEYGTYDLINTLVSLLLPIATLQIHSAAFRFLIDNREDVEEQKKIISNIYAFTIPVSCVVLFFFYFVLSSIEYSTRLLISVYFMIDTIYITQGQIIRGLSHNKTYALASVIASATKCIVIIITLKFVKVGLNGILIAIVFSYLISSLYIVIKVPESLYFNVRHISKKRMKELISYSWPMIPNNLSNWILNISDRIVITFFLGIEANAVYAAANSIPNIMNLAKGVVIMAWQENASVSLSDEDVAEYYSEMFKKMYALIAGVTALLMVLSPLIFKILIRGSYAEAYVQVPVLILGFFYSCISSFQGGIYIAHKKTKSVGITTMIAALINIIVDLLLVNVIGIFAGTISTLVSYFVLFIYRLIDVKRFQKIYYSYRHIIVISVVLMIIAILEMINNKELFWLNAFLGLAFAYAINMKLCNKVVKMVQKIFIGKLAIF